MQFIGLTFSEFERDVLFWEHSRTQGVLTQYRHPKQGHSLLFLVALKVKHNQLLR